MEINQETGARMLSVAEFAQARNVSTRTVKRWLAAGELPDAERDPYNGGQWQIPENATRVLSATSAAVTQPQNHSEAALAMLPQLAAASGVVPWQPQDQGEPTLREALDDEPGYLDIATASEYLGIPQAQIRANAEKFGLEPVGVNGSMRVPQRIVRRIMGV